MHHLHSWSDSRLDSHSDNVINQKVLKRQLVSKYYTVTLASNGLEALEILGTEQPGPRVDAVLMDIE